MRMTEEQYRYFKGLREKVAQSMGFGENKSKFGSVICEANGIKFRSKRERRRYIELTTLEHIKEVSFFLMQVPFRLPGNTKYLLDFLVFWADGRITYEDVKGHRTPMFIMKKKQVEALFPIKITDPYA